MNTAWMGAFFQISEFSPHGYCLAWEPTLFWSHLVSDAVIAFSYFSIPAVIVAFALQRRHQRGQGIMLLFAVFIISCGITHLFGIWTLWNADYGYQAIAKIVTAIVSAGTAVALWVLLPKALQIPSASDLEREIDLKTRAEAELQSLNAELEARVKERTAELEQLNRQLERAKSEAQQASISKTSFLASMSHEMRTPLNAVIGFSDFLLHGSSEKLSDSQKSYITDIHKSGMNLLHLISDLLDLATIEQGKLNYTVKEVEASVILDDLRGELEALFDKHKLTFSITNRIPEGHTVSTDVRRVQQIIRNFVTNAIKYNRPDGAVELVAALDASGNVVFSVRDEGDGLTEKEVKRLFVPFERLNAHARAIEGTGIGLYISRQIAELIGGRISVDSKKGHGSTFTFTVPAHA